MREYILIRSMYNMLLLEKLSSKKMTEETLDTDIPSSSSYNVFTINLTPPHLLILKNMVKKICHNREKEIICMLRGF